MRPLAPLAWQGAAIAGGVAAMVGLRVAGFVPLVVLGVGFAVYAALLLLLPRQRDKDEVAVAPGLTQEAFEAAMAQADAAVASLRDTRGLLPEAATGASRAADIAAGILAELRRDPARMRSAGPFLQQHLPRVAAVAATTARLGDLPPGVRDEGAITAGGQALQASVAGFQAQFEALVERDMQGLTVAADSLTRMLAAEHGYVVRLAAAEGEKRA